MRAKTLAIALAALSAAAPAASAADNDAVAVETARERWDDRTGSTLTTSLRLDLLGAALTGGAIPSAVDDISAGGAGAGASLRAGYTFLGMSGRQSLSGGAYTALHLGTGLELHRVAIVGDYDLGLDTDAMDRSDLLNGDLEDLGLDFDLETATATTLRVPLVVSASTGLGRYTMDRFNGVGVGLAWTPAYELQLVDGGLVGGDLDPLSFELSLEFARLSSTSKRGQTRLTAMVTLPDSEADIATVGLGFGRVWY